MKQNTLPISQTALIQFLKPQVRLDNIPFQLIEFYRYLSTDLTPNFNLSDKKLLLLLALDYINLSNLTGKRLRALLPWLIQIKERFEDETFQWLVTEVAEKKVNNFNNLLEICLQLCELDNMDKKSSQLFLKEMQSNPLSSKNILKKLVELRGRCLVTKYPEKRLAEVITDFKTIDRNVTLPIPDEDLLSIDKDYQIILKFAQEKKLAEISQYQIKQLIDDFRKIMHPNHDQELHWLALGREALRRQFNIFPHSTQILTTLALLKPPKESAKKGYLGQVKTGEGKSTIVILLALTLAFRKLYVDIITSSSYLAERDQRKYQKFVELFGFTVTSISSDNPTAENFSGNIVYGTNYDFEFAKLRDGLFNMQLRRVKDLKRGIERPYHVIIIDEVDNMLVDRSLESAIMSVEDPCDRRPLLNSIFKIVKSLQTRDKESLNGAVQNFMKLSTDSEKNDLTPFRLKQLIQNAADALDQKKENKDYIIKKQKMIRDQKEVYTDAVVIMDYENTGQPMPNNRWQKGIHEFLELKHDLSIGPSSLTATSISHPIFFSAYRKIVGLTGTLGAQTIRDELRTVYGVETFDVPSYLPSQRSDLDFMFFDNDEQYSNFIVAEAKQMVGSKRAVLILTKTIFECHKFSEHLTKAALNFQIYNALQTEDVDFIISRAGQAGMVTLATNTAGRGTDFVLGPAVIKSGGLHVIFTFFPSNERVEAQGLGRAARQGQPGSTRIVVCGEDEKIKQYLVDQKISASTKNSDILSILKKKREEQINRQSLDRQFKTKIDFINYSLMEKMFIALKKWHEAINTDYLKNYAQKLTVLSKEEVVLVNTESKGKELNFYQELMQRLSELMNFHGTEKDYTDWLTDVKNEITTNVIILSWAQFYDHLDDCLDEIKLKEKKNEKILAEYSKKTAESFKVLQVKLAHFFVDPNKYFAVCLSTRYLLKKRGKIQERHSPQTRLSNVISLHSLPLPKTPSLSSPNRPALPTLSSSLPSQTVIHFFTKKNSIENEDATLFITQPSPPSTPKSHKSLEENQFSQRYKIFNFKKFNLLKEGNGTLEKLNQLSFFTHKKDYFSYKSQLNEANSFENIKKVVEILQNILKQYENDTLSSSSLSTIPKQHTLTSFS